MLNEREVSAAIGSTAYGLNGDKLGTVEHFFLDDRTGAPSWVAVATGLFGTRHSIVPATGATFDDGYLSLPVTADAVKGAPGISGNHLDPDDEAVLRRHYRLDEDRDEDRDETPDVPPGDGDGSMIRSEEQVRLGTERVATTRARLVKYVVTEDVQITVPIRREEIRVEQVPIDAPDDEPGESLAPDGASDGTGGLPGEIILHAESPVVSVEVVPIERVRLRTELVEGQETVTEQVQRERIVVDQDTRSPEPRRGS
jgi:stress response protein YsnF